MNLEGISKAQRGERHSSPLVQSTTRVPLPLSARDLLWKHHLEAQNFASFWTPADTKAKYLSFCLSLICCDSYRKPSSPLSTVLSHQPFEPSVSIPPLYLPSQCLLAMQVAHRWYTGLRQGRNSGDQCVIYFFKPLIYIFGEAKKQRIYDSPLTFHQITSIL